MSRRQYRKDDDVATPLIVYEADDVSAVKRARDSASLATLLQTVQRQQQQQAAAREANASLPEIWMGMVERRWKSLLLLVVATVLLLNIVSAYCVALSQVTLESRKYLLFLEDAQQHREHYDFLAEAKKHAEYLSTRSQLMLAYERMYNNSGVIQFVRTHNDRIDRALDSALSQHWILIPLLITLALCVTYGVVSIINSLARSYQHRQGLREMGAALAVHTKMTGKEE